MNKQILKKIEMLASDKKLKKALNFYAIYLLLFEQFKGKFVNELRYFLCDISLKNGKEHLVESKYYERLKNRKYNGKTNIFISSMEWFYENQAINIQEFKKICDIRNDRNEIGHNLLELISNGYDEAMEENFLDLIKIFIKIDKWWINNIEVPITAEDIPEDYDMEGVMSVNWLLCEMVIDTLYGEKKYEKILEELKKE